MTTYGATSDDNVVKLTIFCFQWIFKQGTVAQYCFLTGTNQYNNTRLLQINFMKAIIGRTDGQTDAGNDNTPSAWKVMG